MLARKMGSRSLLQPKWKLRVPSSPRECIILEAQVAPLPWGRWHILEGITLPHTTLSLQVSEALELRLLWDPKRQLSG